MSSPSQHPNSFRQPSSDPHTSQPSTLQQQPSISPFSKHLPPPPLPSSNGPSVQPISLPPPRVRDRPYQSPMRSPISTPSGHSAYGMNNNYNNNSSNSTSTIGGHLSTALPLSSSFGTPEHTSSISQHILPPLPPPSRASSPYDDHRHSPFSLPPPPTAAPSSLPQQQEHRRRSVTPPPPVQHQQEQQQQEQSPTESSGGYRPLNVRDALTYLDQVKIRFSDQPDVYNRFLDIMKDFKSQAIDTPGVIERVSTLFKGHPNLISGFNTFLPPGYRIECSTNPHEPDLIRVTTPDGTITTTGGRMNLEPETMMSSQPSYGHSHHQLVSQQPPYGIPPQTQLPPPPTSHQNISMHPSSRYSHYGSTPPPPPSMMSSAASSHIVPVGRSSAAPSHHPPPLTSPAQNEKQSPVEFDHAITFVNKIKNRFANEPDVYKQFLEILQTYQKEQKPIQEVYAHVQYLFNGAPDLLSEFKQFLPDITGQPASVLFPDDQGAYYGDDSTMGNYGGGKRGGMSQKKKRGPAPLGAMGKRSKAYHKTDDGDGLRSSPYAFPASPFDPLHPTVSSEEVDLFERIRKYIGNKPSYEEFLKTLNLYTQQIVDLDMLMDQVKVFIGSNKELFDWFKSVLAYESKEHPITRPTRTLPKPDLMHCATVADSPSYRLAPVEWQNQPCSGRDQLAWEVLNDVYVSHPIWASEDDGFLASKKSQYEEAMHRCEEERYDYNMNIEANLNTIALLEPISKKLEMMTTEEKAAYRLYPGLGGQSVTIYERIIKKVYDKERGMQIIELLYSNPAQVVPILLKRLKQKDKEWKKAQREWNRIWRELDSKNYYRSLDYQGITYKGNDRKAMAVKTLVAEIEGLHKAKKLKQTHKNVSTKNNCQYMYAFPDKDVFKDVTRVVYSYIDRQTGFNNHDREKVRTFIRSFIPLCFNVDNVEPEGASNYWDDNDDDEMMDDDDDAQSTNTEDSESDVARSPSKRSTSPSPRRSRRGRNQEDDHTMDLLRDVLTKNKKALDEMGPVNTRSSSQSEAQLTGDNDDDVDVPAAKSYSAPASPQPLDPIKTATPPLDNEGLLVAAAAATAPESRKRIVYSFFCNTTFYAFFRLFEMIYGRLLKLKTLNEAYMADRRYAKQTNEVALQLGLYTTKFNDIDTSNGYYQAILGLIDRFFEGEIEPQLFEESMRYFFVTDAYILFTIDKLVHALVKQIQAVTVDTDSVELVRLFRSDQELDITSRRLLSVYRLRAEEIVGSEENLYKINFDTKSDVMSIQLLDSDDYMLDPTKEDKYEDYVISYMNWVNPTEGVDVSKMKPSYMKRNLQLQNGNLQEIYVRSQLQYKIDQDTYHMCYIDGSEDVFIRPTVSKE
ncbi:hypothetical protein BC941DRAFT_389690 [Chlamydoabsidia padenii]|nr:hypothetical protein BC941DRAFT_389690 [Chlamydoabsidia padenii]